MIIRINGINITNLHVEIVFTKLPPSSSLVPKPSLDCLFRNVFLKIINNYIFSLKNISKNWVTIIVIIVWTSIIN